MHFVSLLECIQYQLCSKLNISKLQFIMRPKKMFSIELKFTCTHAVPSIVHISLVDHRYPNLARLPNELWCGTLVWLALWILRNNVRPIFQEFDRNWSTPFGRPFDVLYMHLQRKKYCTYCMWMCGVANKPCPSFGNRGHRQTIARWWCSYLACPDVTSISDSCNWSTVPKIRSIPLILPVRLCADFTEPYLN